MKPYSRTYLLPLLLLSLLLVGCLRDQEKSETAKEVIIEPPASETNEEKEIIAVFEKILIAVGNRNPQELGKLTTDKAIVGWTYLEDGVWKNKEVTVEEYLLAMAENKDPKPISEIAKGYEVSVTDGRLAMVKAETIISQFGVPRSREVNNFLMIKEQEDWKLFSIAWTVHRIPEEEKSFDLDLFAHSYAQVWCSNKPEFVAMFYEENGSLQVNDGDPAIGRGAISEVANSFMTQFPDMVVRFDSLTPAANGTRFHWTLTGTDASPDGKGNAVDISGYELWQMGSDGRIANSKGYFSEEEYNRQLEFGMDN